MIHEKIKLVYEGFNTEESININTEIILDISDSFSEKKFGNALQSFLIQTGLINLMNDDLLVSDKNHKEAQSEELSKSYYEELLKDFNDRKNGISGLKVFLEKVNKNENFAKEVFSIFMAYIDSSSDKLFEKITNLTNNPKNKEDLN